MSAKMKRLLQLSKEELIEYIETQSHQLQRYEQRFRDVVKAYKGMLKEKEALEASLKALSKSRLSRIRPLKNTTLQKNYDSDSQTRSESDTERSNLKVDGKKLSVSDDSRKDYNDMTHQITVAACLVEQNTSVNNLDSGGREEPDDIDELRDPVSTLSESLAALTEQKSQMEGDFQADKKKMLAEIERSTQQHKLTQQEKEEELVNLRDYVRELQMVLDKAEKDRQISEEGHGEMIRELQKMLGKAREERDDIEKQLHNAERELHDLRGNHEEEMQQVAHELQEVKRSVSASEEASTESPSLLHHLKEEIEQMKHHHTEALQKEQQRANEVEDELRLQAQNEEKRVAALEDRLSQLSATLGNYDRLREGDQTVIVKLKERVSQLDLENTALTKAHIQRQENRQIEDELFALREHTTKLKGLLKLAVEKLSDEVVLPEDGSIVEYSSFLLSQPSKKDYQDELFKLKEEFEKYKTRAQLVLKGKGKKEAETQISKELEELRYKNNALEVELAAVKEQFEDEMEKVLSQNKVLREDVRKQHDLHQQEIHELEATKRQHINELQQRVHHTRERTLTLLKEKDVEIERLREEVLSLERYRPSRPAMPMSLSSSLSKTSLINDGANTTVGFEHGKGSSPDVNTSFSELLHQSSPSVDVQFLHHFEERARTDIMIANLKKAKGELEEVVKDLKEREAMLLDQTRFLKGEIRKQERDRSRETSNMEYIKNIVFHYMRTNSDGREQMIPAIATALHFSEDEVSKIKEKYSKSWTGWR